jgi:hypothetical protein
MWRALEGVRNHNRLSGWCLQLLLLLCCMPLLLLLVLVLLLLLLYSTNHVFIGVA